MSINPHERVVFFTKEIRTKSKRDSWPWSLVSTLFLPSFSATCNLAQHTAQALQKEGLLKRGESCLRDAACTRASSSGSYDLNPFKGQKYPKGQEMGSRSCNGLEESRPLFHRLQSHVSSISILQGRQGQMLLPLYRWGNWGSLRLSGLSYLRCFTKWAQWVSVPKICGP